jgi:hypothetical protein
MKTENCRDWRESLGAYALGHLSNEERAGLEAHLEGCPECRAEVKSLSGVALLLPHADPERFGPAPQPSPELGKRIEATIAADRQTIQRSRRRRRFGLALGGGIATAAVAAALALVILPGGSGEPKQHIDFASLPAGVKIGATLEPHVYGTEINMYVSGIRSGTLCEVFLRGPHGVRVPAGSFRYRWGDDSKAELSSALDLSRTTAIEVHAGNRIFRAPVGGESTAAIDNQIREEAT